MALKPHHHIYKNILLFVISVVVAIILTRIPIIRDSLLHLGKLKYLGAFLGGLLFVSTFTIPIGAMILITLAKSLSPILLILIAGIGAVLGDLIIFQLVKNSIQEEIEPVYDEVEKLVGKNHLRKILHTKYFAWTLPVVGTLILVSPLPDELGLSLMGISKISTKKFLAVAWFSHTIGIFLVVGSLG
jgi:uncharacterized membrane protein YdjX (TVP38/TMEM64 family)